MVIDHTKMNVIAPVQGVASEVRVAEIGLPGVVIAPIEYLDVAVTTHVVVEANHLIVAITQIILLAGVFVKVIDPFDSDTYVHVNAHVYALLWIQK